MNTDLPPNTYLLPPGAAVTQFKPSSSVLGILRAVQEQNAEILRQNALILKVVGTKICFIAMDTDDPCAPEETR